MQISKALFICTFTTFGASASTPPTPAPVKPVVTLKDMKAVHSSDKMIFPARVESKLNSTVVAEAEGLLKSIKKPIGSFVKKGDVVLVLENQDPVFTYASISVRSPFSGIISGLSLSLMSKVNRGDKLFTVTDPKHLKIIAELPAANLNAFSIGSLGAFKVQYDSNEELKVKTTAVSPLVDPQSGTARAEFEFSNINLGNAIPVGTLGQVIFETKERSVLLLPESALVYREGKPFVRIYLDGKMQKKAVVLGPQNNDLFEIKEGLAESDKVIVRANKFVKDGEDVEIEISEKPEDLKK